MAEGLRNETVHIAAVHLLQIGADVMAWAATYAPGLSPQAIAATIKTARQKHYRYSAETIGTKFEVTGDEVRGPRVNQPSKRQGKAGRAI